MTPEEFKTMTVTQGFMGKVLGLSQQRISQLLEEKILVRDEESRQPMLFESLRSYYLSKNAAGDGVNFWKERGLHEKAKRELAELKLAQARGEVYIASEVDAALAEILTDLRNQFLGLGHKLALQLENKTAAQICAIIDGEITQNLKELAEELADVDKGREIGESAQNFGDNDG